MSAPNWSQLIGRAEKLLGGPVPFINLSGLLTSEAGFLATRARRLAATTDHPFFSTVRACLRGRPMPSLFAGSNTTKSSTTGNSSSSSVANKFIADLNRQTRQASSLTSPRPSGGLIMLLLAQTCSDDVTTVTRAHRNKLSIQLKSLAELFETVHMATAIHKSLVDSSRLLELDRSNSSVASASSSFLAPGTCSRRQPGSLSSATATGGNSETDLKTWIANLETGNKLATLAGDVLFASVSATLASFLNAQVVALVSDGISSLIEAEFSPLLTHDPVGHSTAAAADCNATGDWLTYVELARGRLLGSCCGATFLLASDHLDSEAGESEADGRRRSLLASIARVAEQFGRCWAVLSRLVEERDVFRQLLSADNGDLATAAHQVTDPWYRTVSPFGWVFQEHGLPEPSLMDAHLRNSVVVNSGEAIGPPPLPALTHLYETVGSQMAEELRTSWLRFQDLTWQWQLEQLHQTGPYDGNGVRVGQSALLLLDQMIDQLTGEVHS